MDFVDAPNVRMLVPKSDVSGVLRHDKVWLTGRVLDKNCKPIRNAIVHCWYAGGNPGEMFYLSIRKFDVNKFCYDLFSKVNFFSTLSYFLVHYSFPPDHLWYRGYVHTDRVITCINIFKNIIFLLFVSNNNNFSKYALLI